MSKVYREPNLADVNAIKAATAIIPDYPSPGINFVDITTVLCNPQVSHLAYQVTRDLFDPTSYDVIISPEARGWLLAQPMALALNKRLVVVRKKGKLPRETLEIVSTKEYGEDILEVSANDIPQGSRVLMVDDLAATFGTAVAISKLISNLRSELIGIATLYDLDYLEKHIVPCPTHAAVHYAAPPAPYRPDLAG